MGHGCHDCGCPNGCECGVQEPVKVNPVGGSGEGDRGSWCTPAWLAELLGEFALDPCSNPRSNVRALLCVSLEADGDGLLEGRGRGAFSWRGDHSWLADAACDTFINPPYARGQVARWVRHYSHTRFTFLLRWDPSAKSWFPDLIRKCSHIWFPNRRINFEPPPGVKSSSNPYPHALFMRDPPADRLVRLAPHGFLIPVNIRPG